MTEKSTRKSKIPVIYYHSIGPVNRGWSQYYLTLELPFFDAQLKYFAKNFNCIDLREYWEIRNGLRSPVKNALVLTFDDGYLDNWIWAYPLLKKYNLRATIFVNPDFADPRNIVRPNLEDVWEKRAIPDEITDWGFLSWEEMKLMEQSGIINIQSHTLSHSKYFISAELVDFHHPGADSIYTVGNLFPSKKPFYITDPGFERLVPYGYPCFNSTSSVIARRVWINDDFNQAVVDNLKKYDFNNYNFEDVRKLTEPLYKMYSENNILISKVESDLQYENRIHEEIKGSKEIIEQKLDKKVDFLCWPHGDNNDHVHQTAIHCGYLATTMGSKYIVPDTPDRIDNRVGTPKSGNSVLMTRMKTQYKLGKYTGSRLFRTIDNIYCLIKYGSLSQ